MTGAESATAAEARYAALVAALRPEAGVAYGGGRRGGFGAAALKVGGRMFAMLVGGRLVVKLPAARVAELAAAGAGDRFDPGHGRVMREWLVLRPGAPDDAWRRVAREALAFVRG